MEEIFWEASHERSEASEWSLRLASSHLLRNLFCPSLTFLSYLRRRSIAHAEKPSPPLDEHNIINTPIDTDLA